MQPSEINANQPQYQPIYSAPVSQAELPVQSITQKPRKWWVLAIGGVVGAALCGVGIFLHLNYHGSDASGRTANDIQKEISVLDEQISVISETESSNFRSGGFSADFYDSADERTEIELQKAELENARDAILEADAGSGRQLIIEYGIAVVLSGDEKASGV